MNLEKYLNENFPTFSLETLSDHFKTFGVDISVSNNLYQFKYDQIQANWNNPITHFCRGAILRYNEFGWEYVARPWNKFFNRQELFSNYSLETDFQKIFSGEFRQKLDGSCLILYFNIDTSSWKVSTLGSIDTAEINDFGITFSDLFWKHFGTNFEDLVPGNTYLFELCTAYNRIVTKYPEDHLVYLGTLSNESGEAILNQSLEARFKTPIKIPVCPILKNWGDVNDFVEAESFKEIYGKNSEGFVYYENGLPKFKLKNRNYLSLHGVMTGDALFVKKNLVNLFFTDGLDDIYGDLPELMQAFSDRLKERYVEISEKIYQTVKHLNSFKADRKTYALELKKISDTDVKIFSGYFFELYSSNKTFSEWLKSKNNHGRIIYESFMDFWKSL